jgi:hypothetical protein
MRRAIAKRGEGVTFTRVSGLAPVSFSFSADLTAIVMKYAPDGGAASRQGYGANELGGVTQGDRLVILMTQDLCDARYPLPVRKDDKITLSRTGEELTVVSVDASKRGIAGAIEIEAVGVA